MSTRTTGLSWPSPADFKMILQKPEFAFSDPELKTITIARDKDGQPRVWSGKFANVYRGIFPRTKQQRAIRVFVTPSEERTDRYRAIAEYMHQRPELPWLVPFTYDDRGIRSAKDGKKYPLVTMDWVEGRTLFEWVRTKCSKGDRTALEAVTELWVATVEGLLAARIAHGDLQHANVMVCDAGHLELKLVDYDGMCVPALVGRRNLEIGVEPYQHPKRDENTPLSLHLDRFSAILIFVALRALAASPHLWDEYVERPRYEKLLFRREDLELPGRSSLMQKLKQSPDESVRRLSQELTVLYRVGLHQVPPLRDLLFSFRNVQVLLDQRDFDGAVNLLARAAKRIGDAPLGLHARLSDAQERVRWREALEKAATNGNEEEMARLHNNHLLEGYPKAKPLVEIAKKASQVIPILKKLQQALETGNGRELVRTWDTNCQLLDGRVSAHPYASHAELWRQRNQLCDEVLGLCRSGDTTRLEAAWKRLQALGGHPEVNANQINALVRRQAAWHNFQRLQSSPTNSESWDQQLLDAWKDQLFAGWDQAEKARTLVEQSRRRLDRLKQLAAMLQRGNEAPSAAGQAELLRLVDNLPRGYRYALQPQVEQAIQRSRAMENLAQALQEPVSDLAVEAAWREIQSCHADSLVSPAQRGRIAEAETRAPLIRAIQSTPKTYPPSQAQEHDLPLLNVWNEKLLDGCLDVKPWRQACATARRRQQFLTRLQVAVETSDHPRILELAGEDCLTGYPFPADWESRISAAREELRAVEAILEGLRRNDRRRLREAFDADILRRHDADFITYHDQLSEWLTADILPAARMGLGRSKTHPRGLALQRRSRRIFQLFWKWPAVRFCQTCLLGITPGEPEDSLDPSSPTLLLRQPVSRDSYEAGGGRYRLHAKEAWLGSWALVWAIVDLGPKLGLFYSEPLWLGRLEAPGGQKP